MKTTLKELKEGRESFAKILDYPMDIKLSYRLRKIAGKIRDQFKTIEKYRRELIDKYGERKDDNISVPPAKLEEFNKELEKFLDKEFDLDVEIIPWDVVEKSGVKLSGTDFALLEKFVNMPEKLKD